MSSEPKSEPRPEPVVRCKVCAKEIRATEDHLSFYHAGKYYFLCSAACAVKFEAWTQQYKEEP